MIAFLAGAAIGAIGMLLIYRNNKSKMSALADKLNAEIAALRKKGEASE